MVITTQGGKGCTIEDEHGKRSYGAFATRVIDPTGAGDAFAAGYIFGFVRGFDEERIAAIANAMGAIAISQKGPVPKTSWKEVEEFLARNDNKK